jgi:hydroxypyruvate reductase
MSEQLRAGAETILEAAIAAVEPERLIREQLAIAPRSTSASLELLAGGRPLEPPVRLGARGRIMVVGGGKAAAGMAAGVEQVLGPARLASGRTSGLVSVPVGCGRHLEAIQVRETRPAAQNLPTPEVVAATQEILAAVSRLSRDDLVIAVISGGGSALLAAPRPGVTLDEKIAATRRLSEGGADIATLNAMRRTLSLVKGGGLALACTAGTLLVLVLSDVIGSDLGVIASGPCMAPDGGTADGCWTTPTGCRVVHRIIGDNATAVAAAAAAARRAGYEVVPAPAREESSAEAVGAGLFAAGRAMLETARRDGRPRAIISGGEATVTVPADHGLGGRNQQTAVAALAAARRCGGWPAGLLVASVGTDGEDGPTTAAGGWIDAEVAAAVAAQGLDIETALAHCDAHPLLATAGGLMCTGPTGTNVADLRIVLARP